MRELAAKQGFTNGLVDDGSILCGRSYSSGTYRAAIWHSPSEFTLLRQPPGRSVHSECEAASADGSILVGWSHDKDGRRQALRWTAEGVEVLTSATAGLDAMANTVSASGEIIVGMEWTAGTGLSTTDTRIGPVRWTPSGAERLSGFDPAYNWFVHDISADGSVVVGMRWPAGTNGPWTGSNKTMAFHWEDGTVTLLGDLPGGDIYSIAGGVSDDGRIVVGSSIGGGRTLATMWDAAHGLRSLESVLRRHGVVLLDWRVQDATSVSGDGRTIVGWGLRKNGHMEAWLARLPKQAFAGP